MLGSHARLICRGLDGELLCHRAGEYVSSECDDDERRRR